MEPFDLELIYKKSSESYLNNLNREDLITKFRELVYGLDESTNIDIKISQKHSSVDTSAYDKFYNGHKHVSCLISAASKKNSSDNWIGGLYSIDFNLGENFKPETYSTVRFSSKTNIYYSGYNGNMLITKAGENAPFFNSNMKWGEELYKDGIAKVIIDLRPGGVYGSDFNTLMLNDGEGRFGKEFEIILTPKFESIIY